MGAHVELSHGPIKVISALSQRGRVRIPKEQRADLVTIAFWGDRGLKLRYIHEDDLQTPGSALISIIGTGRYG